MSAVVGNGPNYILVGGPEKLSLPAFINFIIKFFPGYERGEMHSLMTEENCSLYVTDFSSKFPKGILSYYAKRMVNRDPMTCLPKVAYEKADVVVWFNLYSNDPVILKDPNGSMNVAVEEWKKYIQNIS